MTDILEAFRKQVKANPEILKSTLLHGSRGDSDQAFPASIKTEQRASSQAVDVQAPIGSAPSPAPPVPRLSGYALDPRPDLTDDHWYWVAVLAEAWIKEHPTTTVEIRPPGVSDPDHSNSTPSRPIEIARPRLPGPSPSEPSPPLYGLLHGLRCGGAKLEWRRRGRTGNGHLRLIYKPLLGRGGWDEDKLLKDWLQPVKDEMRECFEAALETYNTWEKMQAKRAADEVTEEKTGKSSRNSEGKTEEQAHSAFHEPSQASLFRPA